MNNGRLCQVGVDIGGTFTDVVLLWDDGTLVTRKVSSTPQDYSAGIVGAIGQLMGDCSIPADAIHRIVHGTTVATNAILEKKGARTALITTRGFRDVLELRRIRIPRLYDLFFERPAPLVPRRRRFEVEERIGARGEVVTALKEEDVQTAVQGIREAGVEAVAVCLLNSFAHPDHERRLEEILRRELDSVYLSLSCEVLPEIREYERTSTTTINAYVGPIVQRYLRSLQTQLAGLEVHSPLLVMQSSGGIMNLEAAVRTPAHLIESGPAAGAVAAARLARTAGYPDIISFDMGGTTAKAALVEGGRLSLTSEAEVGGGITLSSRLTKGGGYALKFPMIDLSEVGSGGGSIARLNRSGLLEVGPDSAGAEPGPACYDRGGQEITVTDANLILGYLNPDYLAGGTVLLNKEKTDHLFERKISGPLGKEPHEAAFGIHLISNATMIRAVKAVTTYRGRDPRDFVLVAFGGSGPVHAAHMARTMGIRRVVVPLAPGLFSALGLLLADVECHFTHTFLVLTTAAPVEALNRLLERLEGEGKAQLAAGGFPAEKIVVERSADLRYQGQAFELNVRLPDGVLDRNSILGLDEAFGRTHEKEYGHRALDDPVEIVNLRVTLRIPREGGHSFQKLAGQLQGGNGRLAAAPPRTAYFGPSYGFRSTPVLRRWDLKEETPGPLIIEEPDATTVAPPDSRVYLDDSASIVIDLD